MRYCIFSNVYVISKENVPTVGCNPIFVYLVAIMPTYLLYFNARGEDRNRTRDILNTRLLNLATIE